MPLSLDSPSFSRSERRKCFAKAERIRSVDREMLGTQLINYSDQDMKSDRVGFGGLFVNDGPICHGILQFLNHAASR